MPGDAIGSDTALHYFLRHEKDDKQYFLVIHILIGYLGRYEKISSTSDISLAGAMPSIFHLFEVWPRKAILLFM